MAGLSQNIELQLFSKTPLLITESKQDFSALSAALTQEIKPSGIVERMLIADIAALDWEILQLRRCKIAIVNTVFKDALSEIVYRLAGEPEMGTPKREWVEAVTNDWFSRPGARKEVLQLLRQFHLNEWAIEAEAIRLSFSEIEMFDRMIASLESRRNKALRSIAEYREGFAKRVREVSNRVIEGDPVIRLKSNRK
jgi:hypothetical protein